MYYTYCVDHTPLCNIGNKVCIVSSHTWCVDYTHCTRLYTVALHTLCTQSMSNYWTVTIFYVQSGKIYTGQKNLHGHRPWRPWQISGMCAAMQNVHCAKSAFCKMCIVQNVHCDWSIVCQCSPVERSQSIAIFTQSSAVHSPSWSPTAVQLICMEKWWKLVHQCRKLVWRADTGKVWKGEVLHFAFFAFA